MSYSAVIIAVATMLASASAMATEKPYRVTLAGDAYDGGQWTTGVRIELADGWKTYWRMPGDAGIPPQFTWTTSVPASVDVRYPLPARYQDASGETVGYKHEVVFPVAVKAGDATTVKLDLDLFFAVCKDICIPADAKASIDLGSAMTDPAGSLDVAAWQAQVPQAGKPVAQATLDTSAGKPVLRLDLTAPADDVFVETDTGAYFRKPSLSADSRTAELAVDNVKDASRLKGAVLKVTVVSGGKGLEQQVTLP